MYIFFLIWKVGEPDKSTNACPRMVQDWLNSFILDKSYKHRRLNLWFTSASSYLFCFRRTCCPSIMLCMQRFWRRNLQCFFQNGHFILGCYVLYHVTFTFEKQSLLGLSEEQFYDVTVSALFVCRDQQASTKRFNITNLFTTHLLATSFTFRKNGRLEIFLIFLSCFVLCCLVYKMREIGEENRQNEMGSEASRRSEGRVKF